MKNFYPDQYRNDSSYAIKHNYLHDQFSDHDQILAKIKNVVLGADFTLGSQVDAFEEEVAALLDVSHVVGVNSGTDAIFLSLYAAGIRPGDEVITTSFTFYATVGAIGSLGATPVFVDIGEDFNLDPRSLEAAITPKTKAIVPVHWAGRPCDMDEISVIASRHNLVVVEDACHGILGEYKGRKIGSLGDFGCFSLHPLKNLNVWGDGGFICVNDPEMAQRLRLLRNHGLQDRDTCVVYGFNSRLDTVQAVVARHMLEKLPQLTEARIKNSETLDRGLMGITELSIPPRLHCNKEVFHLYCFRASRRDDLIKWLQANGVDAKIHYPTAMHLQPASRNLGYAEGDFPVAERAARETVSLPVHEFVSDDDLHSMISLITEFYGN